MSVRQKVSSMFETPIKTIQTLAALVAAIGSLLGSAFYFDGRYAHADQVDKKFVAVEENFKQQRLYMEQSFDQQRRQQIDDKLFELRQIERPTKPQEAMIKRYEDELRRLDRKLMR